MSYGARRGDNRIRRKSAVQPHDGGPDPTIIPNSTVFGFLERLPWKIGGKGLKYKPSAADLQEHPGSHRFEAQEGEDEPLIEEGEGADSHNANGRGRKRSGTANSGSTSDSFRSRGDLFPSDGEDDAVPLDDEFTTALERRTTGDDTSSGKSKSGKKPSGSRLASRSASSRDVRFVSKRKRASSASGNVPGIVRDEEIPEPPSMAELQREEERAQAEEEEEIERKRAAAQKLALERGLGISEGSEVCCHLTVGSRDHY
jgi:hypothetical protein